MNPDEVGTKQRRKKATRACSHCQKAHLTCDDSRPCQRCIKRGLESTCADGARKRAKYLQDDEYGTLATLGLESSVPFNANIASRKRFTADIICSLDAVGTTSHIQH
ncbi:hypothetical protein BX666DRAFT_1947429 [Dichotomocladium elegans]|nr:hypothetical protein BX666DRAFT_1947429 [Dichotomocladium elegans]